MKTAVSLSTFTPAPRLPRYTSYPPVTQLSEQFSRNDAVTALRDSNGNLIPADLAVYLHIPYCRKLCWYCGCNKQVTQRDQPIERYLGLLDSEAELLARHVDRDRTVRLLQIGGGTPNVLSPDQLRGLLGGLRRRFRVDAALDAGIELDPRLCDVNYLAALKELGFTRISFGIQDLDPKVQRAINRVQPAELVLPLLRAASSLGFESVNADLVYGLPLQTPAGIAHTVDLLSGNGVSRFALFEYAHLPAMFPAQRMLERSGVPGGEHTEALRLAGMEGLVRQGFQRVGLDHFARPGEGLLQARQQSRLRRGFQGYFAGAGLDLLGLGVSAISEIGDVILQNEKSMRAYRQLIAGGQTAWFRACFKSAEDHLRGDWIEQLMCYGSVRRDRAPNAHGLHSERVWKAIMGTLLERYPGIVQVRGDQLQVPQRHWDRLRELAAVFDAYRP